MKNKKNKFVSLDMKTWVHAALIVGVIATASHAENPVLNPSFEEPSIPENTWVADSVEQWNFSGALVGTNGVAETPECTAQDGVQFIIIQGSASASQIVKGLKVGETYELVAHVRMRNDPTAKPSDFLAKMGDLEVILEPGCDLTPEWQKVSGQFKASHNSMLLVLRSIPPPSDSSGVWQFAIDNISIIPAPAKSTKP